jgi:cysteine desulfurase
LDRIYLDHNATSPLAPAVTRWLAKGDLLWGNPSSQHLTGKRAAHALDEARSSLYKTFQLTPKTHALVYHSGATEAVNTTVAGLWLAEAARGTRPLFVYSPLDHSCVRAQAARLNSMGHATVELIVDRDGQLQLEESVSAIKAAQQQVDGHTLINFTWVHNETGVVWPLALALALKEKTKAIIHVDAAQAPAKVANCWQLNPLLDIYSFSSHKAGGFKGHGHSFIALDFVGQPLILGGGQQKGARAGTENVMGALALQLALEEMQAQWKPAEQLQTITLVREFMDQHLKGKGERIARGAPELNLNTILFVINKLPSDMSLPMFDLAGLEVSAGAACSSGAAKPSHVLENLGLGARAKNGLRLSTSWGFNTQDWEKKLRPSLLQVLEKLPLSAP